MHHHVDPSPGGSRLAARGVSLGYGADPVVKELSCEVPDGRITVIVGANACGKSTLLRGMARLLRPTEGAVLLDGQAISTLPSRQVARILGLLPQSPVTPEGVGVADLVGRGRHPHQRAFRTWSREDEEAVAEAMALTHTVDLAGRLVDELSGGQRQRVWIAMALAQHTDLLLLDEPTTYLDVAHQVEVLDLLADLNEKRGTTIVMVLHDLNMAARYADHLIALRDGRIVAAGPPGQVITEDCVHDVFGMQSRVIEDPVTGTPMVIPLGRRSRTRIPEELPAMTQTPTAPSVLISLATVHAVRRLSPAFVRVELASPSFRDLGEDGFDTRFKVLFPGATGELPEIPEVAEDFYEAWLGTPDSSRAPMRTYTVRDVVREGDEVRLVVDFVVHEPSGHAVGPACSWALAARVGDVVQVIAPHRLSEYGGTEFDPAGHRHLLLVGDETAVPAIARILADLPAGHHGEVFVEVPSQEDILDLPSPEGFEVRWLVRNHAPYNRRLVQEVRQHLGLPPSTDFEPVPAAPSTLDVDVWETPRFSASGEDVEEQLHSQSLSRSPGHLLGHDLDDTYAWIAGESWMVKMLRRSLVSELGVARAQVAFMGYWREGVSMKS